jgi:hypothetical protein
MPHVSLSSGLENPNAIVIPDASIGLIASRCNFVKNSTERVLYAKSGIHYQ